MYAKSDPQMLAEPIVRTSPGASGSGSATSTTSTSDLVPVLRTARMATPLPFDVPVARYQSSST